MNYEPKNQGTIDAIPTVMYLIDTHTHIYLPEFADDREAMIGRAEEKGVQIMLMPAIDSSTHAGMLELERDYKGCLSMIGLHPCSVKSDYEKELELVNDYLKQRKFVAIGETGLDFYWDKTFTSEQYMAFRRQAEWALEYDLPLVIHSRESIDECIEVVKSYPGLRGVFHCFSGSESQAKEILETGFYLGIGGVVSFKNAGLDKVVAKTGLSKLVLETDAPYLAPVPYRGKRNEPAYLMLVAEKLAMIMDCSVEEVTKITTENARNLFRLSM